MEMVLESIQSLPGVSCVFFFEPNVGIVSRKSGPDYNEENLSSVAQTLEKFFSWGAELFSDIEHISLQYDLSCISVTHATKRLYLIIIHDPILDANLLDMTVSQALNNPKTSFKSGLDSTGTASVSESGPSGAAQPANRRMEAILSSEPASRILSILEDALNKVMGPMASIIFGDTREAWINSIDRLNQSAIEQLIQMLCTEIGEPEKIKVFKNLIAPNLKSQ